MWGAVLIATAATWTYGGYVEEDVRVTRAGEWERVQTVGALRVEGAWEDGFRVVADGRVLHRGEGGERAQIGERTPLWPWRVDGDALFVEARSGGTWVRIGRQSVRWGKGLIANPVSLVSPPDLEDPLRFGSPRGAEMVRVLAPAGPVTLELIALHSFRPALLPEIDVRGALASSGEPAAENIANDPAWTVDLRTYDRLPEATFREMPLAARISGELPWLGAELAASWYRGRAPVPEVSRADLDVDLATQTLSGDLRLTYPRLQSFGAEAVAEVPVPVLDAIALFGEAVWIVPDGFTRTIASPLGEDRESMGGEPYLRSTLGAERAGETYLAVEWSRGFLDEFGADARRDYVFAVAERRFLRETVRLRVVAGHCLDDGSRVLAPDLEWSPRDSWALAIGGYAGFGAENSKFGGPLAGDRVALARVRASF